MFDITAELEIHKTRVEDINELVSSYEKLNERGRSFASSLIEQFTDNHTLSRKQWDSVKNLVNQIVKIEPLYGDFKAVQVMFMLAATKLQKPKIRLVGKEGRFIQLNFDRESRDIDVYVDGWQGHGRRQYVGKIVDNVIKPHNPQFLTDEVSTAIQEFALDPEQVAKAAAAKLGACCFCGRRLSDPTSKRVGYGKTCASHYNLKWE